MSDAANLPVTEDGISVNLPQSKKRPWSVTTVGFLLILQAVFLFLLFPVLVGFEVYKMPDAQLSWLIGAQGPVLPDRVEILNLRQLQATLVYPNLRVPVPGNVITSLAYCSLALPALVTAIFFLRLRKHAWTIAVLWQGVILALSLFIYYNFRHPFVYLAMVSGIFMIFYLNYFEVRQAFLVGVKEAERKV